jgi:SAM-dependent methyltransferase
VKGVPVLIDEAHSVFRSADIIRPAVKTGAIKNLVRRTLPTLSASPRAVSNFERLRRELLVGRAHARVLIVGCGDGGGGTEVLATEPRIELVEADVFLGQRVQVVADGHRLPFPDSSFDGVVLQAVLEHVVAPMECVAEAYRVLRTDGLIYSEVPFMQQVHLGAHDFTRWTLGGHRTLMKDFVEIDAGVACGPGMALAWSIHHFARSFSRARSWRIGVELSVPWLTFWLKYLDLYLVRTTASSDAASGTYFLGRRASTPRSARDIIARYGEP